MVRNLLRFSRSWAQIALFVGFGVTSSQVWALGLGEIELNSALNEKLNARIELLDAAGMQPAEVLVTLASSEDFERVGVERFFYLTGLQFEVVVVGNRAWVNISSRQPIAEPYLNFLVQVHWPNGRLLREYTLLLDPPTYSQAAAPSVSAPQQEAAVDTTAGRIERQAAAQTAPRPRTARTEVDLTARTTERAAMPAGEGEFRMTNRNDTLWKIASATLPTDRVNVQQQMLALQRLNPEAFIRNNINLLKAGFVLRIPTESEALGVTRSDAVLEVAVQNDAWRNPERVASTATEGSQLRSQVDATDAGPAAAAAQGEGQLRIVAGTGDSVVGSENAEADGRVAAALEERDRLAREVDELTYQLDREQELSANQLDVKDRQLEVKSQEIAELQQQLAAQQAAATAPQQVQNQSQAPTEAEPWWQSTPVLGGAAAVLVLGLVGGLVTARRRRSEEAYEDDYYDSPDSPDDSPDVAEDAFEDEVPPTVSLVDDTEDDDMSGLQVDDLDDDPDDFLAGDTPQVATADYLDSELDSESDPDAERMEEDDAPTGSETGDVIGEADIYIAYGRYPQAISLLLGVLEEDPGRNDVRLKLLECYVETSDRAGFDLQMIEFVESCDDEEALLTARELEGRLSESEIVPSGSDAESPEPETAAVETELEELDTVEDFDLKLDEPEAVAEETDSEPKNTSSATSGLEFELELDEQPPEASEALESELEAQEGSSDDLGGDLGMDFDPDADTASPDAAAQELAEAMGENEVATDVDTASATVEAANESDASEPETGIEDGFSLDDLDVGEEEVGEEVISEDKISEEKDETDFDFDEEGDSASTKLDLARAYIDMGDEDGARDILGEVLTEGNDTQQQQAQKLLDQL